MSDYHNSEAPIAGALVELFQLASLSGPSLLLLDKQETDAEVVLCKKGFSTAKHVQGTVNFKVEVNGKYSVRISRDGFLPTEDQIVVNCSRFHCSACNPELKPQLKADFCADKVLNLAVLDALTNLGVAGATVNTWAKQNSERDGGASYDTNHSGIALIPLKTNGFHQFEILQAGYTTLTKELEVNVPQGSCDVFHPMLLAPLSPQLPPSCKHGLRASLAWAMEDLDLDLYSWRMDNNNTENTCLTYFCDGKDPCSGITHDIDSKAGGLNGSETITYCNDEDFVHMIFVDGGTISSWGKDSLQLTLQGEERSLDVFGSPADQVQASKRYWLAGCLLLQDDGQFVFSEVNLFFSEQPSVEQPDYCYNIVKLRRLQQKRERESIGELVLSLRTDQTLFEATVELRLASGMTRFVTANENCLVRFVGINPGHLTISVQAPSHQPALVDLEFSCDGDLHCQHQLEIHLVPETKPGYLQLSLLGFSPGEMELHLVEINEKERDKFCETYQSQPTSCIGSNYSRIGGGEQISLSAPASRPFLHYMVFVKDTSTSEANFDLQSKLRLAVSYEGRTKTHQISDIAPSSYNNFWLAGCLKVIGDKIVFLEVDIFSRLSPVDLDRLRCVGLLKNRVDRETFFCPSVSLKVNTIDNVDRRTVEARIIVRRLVGGEDQEVDVPHFSNQVPIDANGLYKVRATAPGYLDAFQEIKVDCELDHCARCQPAVEVPLVKVFASPGVSLTMLAPVTENLPNPASINLLRLSAESELLGVIKPEDEDVQSVFIKEEPKGDTNHYLVAVQLADEMKNNKKNVHVLINDHMGEELRVEMTGESKYRAGRYWLVGCITGQNITAASFTEVQRAFLNCTTIIFVTFQVNVMMNSLTEATNSCSRFLLTRQKNCLTSAKGPGYTIEEASEAKVLPAATTMIPRDCSLTCSAHSDCKAWTWDLVGGCKLFKEGKISGFLAGMSSFAGTCP